MKILVIGGGGREHALVWKLGQSAHVSEVVCAPGNGGIAHSENVTCIPVDAKNVGALASLATQVSADLTVVGPEVPLTLGVVDEFNRRGMKIFGPTQAAARLESSKSFAKEFMQRHQIPTAHYATCGSQQDVKEALAHFHTPIVVKADGLAAGKGVVIASSKDEAAVTASEMLSGRMLGPAGAQVVLEEFLQGDELSFLVVSDGQRVVPLAAAQDHKRVGEGDTGANTGGMGAYSTPDLLDAHMRDWLLHHIALPTINGMREEGAEYRGVLYCGLMMTARGPMVLEYNCRFGDPETQPIMMRMESDLVDAIEASIAGELNDDILKWSNDSTACVVAVSGGYPEAFEAGKRITGLDDTGKMEGAKIFHAGTSFHDHEYFTSGGRVLGVTARAPELPGAVERAYAALKEIHFEGMYYRRDIAARALKASSR